MDKANFFHYTRMGTFYRKLTPYKNVTELAAGTFFKIGCSNLHCTEKKYWDIHGFYKTRHTDSQEESLHKVDTFLRQAVKRRIESSDLEVACHAGWARYWHGGFCPGYYRG